MMSELVCSITAQLKEAVYSKGAAMADKLESETSPPLELTLSVGGHLFCHDRL